MIIDSAVFELKNTYKNVKLSINVSKALQLIMISDNNHDNTTHIAFLSVVPYAP